VGRVLHPTHLVYLLRDTKRLGPIGRCIIAETLLAKMRGLLLTQRPPAGWGALLRHCSSVHTWGMSFPIDIVFLKSVEPRKTNGNIGETATKMLHLNEGTGLDLGALRPMRGSDSYYLVISVLSRVSPWRLPQTCRGATDVLELVPLEPDEQTWLRGIQIEKGDLIEVRAQAGMSGSR